MTSVPLYFMAKMYLIVPRNQNNGCPAGPL
jgi:hypothetical protein